MIVIKKVTMLATPALSLPEKTRASGMCEWLTG